MDLTRLIELISGHTGLCVLTGDDKAVCYEDLLQSVYTNMSILRKRVPGELMDMHAVLIDVHIGWRVIPILLAALALQMTVIPVDPIRQNEQYRAIRHYFHEETLITADCLNASGELLEEAVGRLRFSLHEELCDVAFVLFTSGTTGHAKGVMLTYNNGQSNLDDILDYFSLGKRDRLYMLRPLNYASALIGELLAGLMAGCSFVFRDKESAPHQIVKAMSDNEVSILCTTPTVAALLSRCVQRYELPKFSKLVLSGERANAHQFDGINRSFPPCEIWNAYGLTEASPRVSCLTSHWRQYGAQCVGHPLRHTHVRIMDEQGNSLPDGETGQLVVSGPNIMKGYFRDPLRTEQRIIDGELHTQDLAYMLDGMIYVRGRKDAVIIRAGINIHPEEVENAILGCQGVKEVLVFADEHSVSGTKLRAWVVTEQDVGVKHIADYLYQIGTDQHLVPDQIELKAELPRTASGKLVRNLMTGKGNN